MAVMFGDGNVINTDKDSTLIRKTWQGNYTAVPAASDKFIYGTKELSFSQLVGVKYYDAMGAEITTPSDGSPASFLTATVPTKNLGIIEISANSFPGTYYVTGDTYARAETTGEDEFFQFIIAKAKMNAENTITLEAEGDPSVFNMSLRVLRPADGKMMKLIKYDLDTDAAAG